MRLEGIITRVFVVVDRALRATFPADYDKRCMYAAFAIRDLLRSQGLSATIVGGEFAAFVVSTDERRAGLQGFGSNLDSLSHYWVETCGKHLDLGPHYLPRSSTYPVVRMPIVSWSLDVPFPLYLRYRQAIRYDENVELSSDTAITARMSKFRADCNTRYKNLLGQPHLPIWLLTNPESLNSKAKEGDIWARNALRYSQEFNSQIFPF